MNSMDGVPEALAHAMKERGIDGLTPVQAAVMRAMDPTSDLLVSAHTGSGKTLAFGLALAAHVLGPEGMARAPGAPCVMIVTPTRELAMQVSAELAWLYDGAGARVACCIGGADARVERGRLAGGCAIVVGTPGRLREHIAKRALDAGLIDCVVLDEADDMLDLGFREDIGIILAAIGAQRRTLMFSATISPRVEKLAAAYQKEALRIDAGAESGPGGRVRFEAMVVARRERERAIVNVLRRHEATAAMVFCATREAVADLAMRLSRRGFGAVGLSGALTQAERFEALSAIREGRKRVCVATDLAARGLDLPRLELVIHGDPPQSGAALAHRSGRTGRAGRPGRVVFVTDLGGRRRLAALAKQAGVVLDWVAAPGEREVLECDVGRMVKALGEVDPAGATEAERAAAAAIVRRHDAATIATGYVREYRGARPAAERLDGECAPTREDDPAGSPP
jgi:ATP-dependent RNA helicase DeaD